jgi:integrase
MRTRGKRSFGNVRQLPSGRWQARYPDPATGGLVAAPGTFDTKRTALGWLSQVEADMSRGAFVDPRRGQVRLEEYAQQVLANRVLEQRTQESYGDLLRLHICPVLGDIEIGQLAQSPITVEGWYAGLARRHPSTASKAYRLLSMVMNTAVRNGDIVKNPCQIRGASREDAAERPTATLAEVEIMVAHMPDHLAAIVLLATWTALRRGELLGLRRRDIDLLTGTVNVTQTMQQLRRGALITKGPKSRAGRRSIAIPPHILNAIAWHLDRFVGPDGDSLVFTGEKGGPLRPHMLQKYWSKARLAAGRPDLHLQDLRHTGNTWAAATGASTKELMARMGHDDERAAIRYQHATEDRDRVIAEALADFAQPAEVIPIDKTRRNSTNP